MPKPYPQHKAIKVSITTTDGELIDSFIVTHWQSNPGDLDLSDDESDDCECVGSSASECILADRIRRYVEVA